MGLAPIYQLLAMGGRINLKNVAATSPNKKEYEQIMPHVQICNEYSDAHVNSFMIAQRTLARTLRQNTPTTAYILDDCIHSSIMWKTNKHLRALFMNGRCAKISTFFALTYPFKITPEFGCNIEYTFIFNTRSPKVRQQLYNLYCAMIPSFEIFEMLMNNYTQDYGSLVIDNTVMSSNWQDMVFWYRGEIRPDFTIGIPDVCAAGSVPNPAGCP